MLVASGTTTSPDVTRLAPAAPITTPATDTVVRALLIDRLDRAVAPPITRRAVTRPAARHAPRVVAKARHTTAVRHRLKRRAEHHTIRHSPARHIRHTARSVTRVAVRGAGVVIHYAKQQIGDPYVWGADSPGGWDCSGLMLRSFARAGIRLPRTAADQSARGSAVPASRARAGDLVLWGGVGRAYHVAVYLGGGMVLHSPRPGKTVRIAPLWGHPQFRRLL